MKRDRKKCIFQLQVDWEERLKEYFLLFSLAKQKLDIDCKIMFFISTKAEACQQWTSSLKHELNKQHKPGKNDSCRLVQRDLRFEQILTPTYFIIELSPVTLKGKRHFILDILHLGTVFVRNKTHFGPMTDFSTTVYLSFIQLIQPNNASAYWYVDPMHWCAA